MEIPERFQSNQAMKTCRLRTNLAQASPAGFKQVGRRKKEPSLRMSGGRARRVLKQSPDIHFTNGLRVKEAQSSVETTAELSVRLPSLAPNLNCRDKCCIVDFLEKRAWAHYSILLIFHISDLVICIGTARYQLEPRA